MAQDLISRPPTRSAVDDGGRVSTPWAAWFDQLFRVCFAVAQSGTTAERPLVGLFVGRPYFDETIGKPIWWDGSQWVDATGGAA